jgi:hypothetical protein
MNIKQVAKDTARVMTSYLTYQAVRTVINQLSETDPPVAFWLQNFSSKESIQDGEAYLEALFQERKPLAFRILTVREHLANEILEYLPELVQANIQQANLHHRSQQLEALVSLDVTAPTSPGDRPSEPNSEDSQSV